MSGQAAVLEDCRSFFLDVGILPKGHTLLASCAESVPTCESEMPPRQRGDFTQQPNFDRLLLLQSQHQGFTPNRHTQALD